MAKKVPSEILISLLLMACALTTYAGNQKEQSYRGLKFSVNGIQRIKEYDGTKAADGNEFVVVKTIIDRTNFESDFRDNECKLDRAKLLDTEDNLFKSTEQQRRISVRMKDEYGRVYGDAKIPYEWSFEVPAGTRLKTFKFEFADEHVNTGGQDPDENVTSLSFDISNK